jgi:DNA-binding CsgD family transcriptional regulator
MLDHADHDALVAGFYAAAMNERPWPDILRNMAEKFGANASLVQLQDANRNILSHENFGYSREFSEGFFASEAFNNDPRVPFFWAVRANSVYYDSLLYDVEEMNRNPWVRESNAILGVKYQLGAVLALPDNAIGGVAVLTTEEQGHASAEAIAAFHRLAPHIEQAFAFGHMLECQAATRTALLDALSRKQDGLMIIGRDGQPTFMNGIASEILGENDGLSFRSGVFQAWRAPESRKLQQMIASAIKPDKSPTDRPGGRTLVTRPSGRRPYVISVAAAPATERFLSGQSIACVVHLQDLGRIALPSRQALSQVFGLTERECDFAIELVREASLERAAAAALMAFNTARNHLQSIFRKTNTSTQSELVQLLGRLT